MERTFEIFEEILSIPHSSGKEEKIANYLINFANNHQLECRKDEYNNVFIRKNNHSNKTIILQAHSDMVCVSDNNYDFDNIGIPYYVENDYYKAYHTSLGADDGIGIAIILSMLEEDNGMPNIEVMITTQEETTMLGAMNFDYSLLSGKTLISLDGIKEADIESSSAGMCSITLNKNIIRENNTDKVFRLSVSNLAGGHSGDDIHKNRCNAIKLLFYILSKIGYDSIIDVNIGEKDNVIPNEGYLSFCSKENVIDLKNKVNNLQLNLVDDDSKIKLDIEEFYGKDFISNSNEIVDFINELKDGLLDVFSDDNFPLLSSNVGSIICNNNQIIIKMSIRSADKNKENGQLNYLENLCNKYNLNMNVDIKKPFFSFRENSKIRNLLAETYHELYNGDTIVKKVHACMEGGIISNNIHDLDICTIAPTIDNCHSINEKVSISSTKRVYIWLKETLKKYNIS